MAPHSTDTGGDAEIPAVSHNIKYGGVYGNNPLVKSSGSGGLSARVVQEGGAEYGSSLLHGQRVFRLSTSGKAEKGLGRPGRNS